MLRILRFAVGAVIALGVVVVTWWALAMPAPTGAFRRALPEGPLVIAHQGGDGLWPSNTLYAFERALELGADVLELDVHRTRDGAFVVIHDATVDRTTDGEGAVRELTLAQVAALDAGYGWSPDGARYPYRGMGLRVPTLREVFAAFPGVPVNVEIKPDDPIVASELCALLRREGRTASVMVGSFHDRAMAVFRETCPEVATSAASDDVRGFFVLQTMLLPGLYTPRNEAFQVPVREGGLTIVTPRFVRSAHERNVDVHVWTIDDPSEMRRLLDLGVDGIITDRPDRLLRVLERPVPEGLVPDFVEP